MPVQALAVRDIDAEIAWPPLARGPDSYLVPGDRAADLGRLEQGQARLAPAADVEGRAGPRVRVGELDLDQVHNILDVDQVTDLLAGTAVPDVGERPPEVVAEHPMRENALVDLAHLPRACDDAEAVDHG